MSSWFSMIGVLPRLAVVLALAVLMLGCANRVAIEQPVPPRAPGDPAFVMADGAVLPYRAWLPAGEPWAVVLALHGFNDSRDAWEYPAPSFTAAGIAIIAPDQRGFGQAPDRGRWPGEAALVDDAREMLRQLRARYPTEKLYVMGESMGGAELMRLATAPETPEVDGYVMISPAVWSRAQMNIFMRAGLWLMANLAPGLAVTGAESPVRVTASDNRAALIRLSEDPLTVRETRFDTLRGLVDLMDDAQASAAALRQAPRCPLLLMYGGHDQLVPPAATAAAWRALPPGPRLAFYPNGYHLLLRDHDRAMPIGDVIAWMRDPAAPLPSGADRAAQAWLAGQS